jgi:hypothetical protein
MAQHAVTCYVTAHAACGRSQRDAADGKAGPSHARRDRLGPVLRRRSFRAFHPPVRSTGDSGDHPAQRCGWPRYPRGSGRRKSAGEARRRRGDARRGEARRAAGTAASDLASRAAALSSRAPPRAPPHPSAPLQRQRSGVARRAEAGRCRPVRARQGWGRCAERAGGWDVTRRTACGCCLALPVCHAPRVEGLAQPMSLSPSAHHLRAQAGRRSGGRGIHESCATQQVCTAARLRAEWPEHTARLHDERA